MPDLVNPLAAYRDAYSLLEGQAQDRTRRQAGNALAGGDYQGAQSALYGRGMLQEGQQVGQMQQGMQDRQAAQQTAQAEAEKKAALERLGVLGNATQALRRLPAEQRAQLLQTQIMPVLSQMPGFDEQMLQQVMQSDLSDQSLDAFGALLGQEAQKLQVVNRGNGGYDVVDLANGQPVRSVEPSPAYQSISPGETLLAVPRGQPSAGLDVQAASTAVQQILPGAQITSGARTPERNAAVGGAPNSYHLRGEAVDIVPPAGVSFEQFRAQLQSSGLPVTELINEGDHWHWAFGGKGPQVVAQGAPKPQGGFRPATTEDRQRWGVPDGVPLMIDIVSGEPKAISGTASAMPKPTPTPIVTAYRENRAARSKIEGALAVLAARPESVGMARVVGEWANQMIDPAGIDARAAIADIGSQIIHDRSGAAVTISEAPRLKPFVPMITDTPEAARKKLKRLLSLIDQENGFMESDYPDLASGRPATRPPPAARPAAAAKPASAPVRVKSPQEAMALPPGTVFITPDGRTKVR